MTHDRKGGLFSFLLAGFRKRPTHGERSILEESDVNESKRRIEQRIEMALQVVSDSSPERRMLSLVPTPRVPALKPPRATGLFVAEDYYLEAQNEGWQESRAAAS